MLAGDAVCGTDPTQGPEDGLGGCVKLLALLLVRSVLPKCGMAGAADLIY